jgi:hypothetical protein
MSQRAVSGNNGKLQATILKKCSREFHRLGTNKQCAGGTCQHTCDPDQVARCRHAWTVRYTVNGVQRDKSFRDEIDAARRVQWGTGLKKAQDFQLELTRGKRAQGKTYVDPKAGNELFGAAAESVHHVAGDPHRAWSRAAARKPTAQDRHRVAPVCPPASTGGMRTSDGPLRKSRT